jgi:uncharacterized protein YdcH (DUF465 family)
MEANQELIDRALKESHEFKKLFEEHSELKNRVEDLNKLKFLNPEQEMEKKKIQKLKLKSKDLMDEFISNF